MTDIERNFFTNVTPPYQVNSAVLDKLIELGTGKVSIIGGGLHSAAGNSDYYSRVGGLVWRDYGSASGDFPRYAFFINIDISDNAHMRGGIMIIGGRVIEVPNQSIAVTAAQYLYIDANGQLTASTGDPVGAQEFARIGQLVAVLSVLTVVDEFDVDNGLQTDQKIWIDGYQGTGAHVSVGNNWVVGRDLVVTGISTFASNLTASTGITVTTGGILISAGDLDLTISNINLTNDYELAIGASAIEETEVTNIATTSMEWIGLETTSTGGVFIVRADHLAMLNNNTIPTAMLPSSTYPALLLIKTNDSTGAYESSMLIKDGLISSDTTDALVISNNGNISIANSAGSGNIYLSSPTKIYTNTVDEFEINADLLDINVGDLYIDITTADENKIQISNGSHITLYSRQDTAIGDSTTLGYALIDSYITYDAWTTWPDWDSDTKLKLYPRVDHTAVAGETSHRPTITIDGIVALGASTERVLFRGGDTSPGRLYMQWTPDDTRISGTSTVAPKMIHVSSNGAIYRKWSNGFEGSLHASFPMPHNWKPGGSIKIKLNLGGDNFGAVNEGFWIRVLVWNRLSTTWTTADGGDNAVHQIFMCNDKGSTAPNEEFHEFIKITAENSGWNNIYDFMVREISVDDGDTTTQDTTMGGASKTIDTDAIYPGDLIVVSLFATDNVGASKGFDLVSGESIWCTTHFELEYSRNEL